MARGDAKGEEVSSLRRRPLLPLRRRRSVRSQRVLVVEGLVYCPPDEVGCWRSDRRCCPLKPRRLRPRNEPLRSPRSREEGQHQEVPDSPRLPD